MRGAAAAAACPCRPAAAVCVGNDPVSAIVSIGHDPVSAISERVDGRILRQKMCFYRRTRARKGLLPPARVLVVPPQLCIDGRGCASATVRLFCYTSALSRVDGRGCVSATIRLSSYTSALLN